MANNQNQITSTINVQANTQQATTGLQATNDLLQQLVDSNNQLVTSINNTTNAVTTGAQQQTQALNNSTNATNRLSKGFKGIGLAFKAIGVGLILEAFNILKELFMQNEQVANAFAVATKSIGIIFNDLVSFITDKVVPAFKAIFENPKQALIDFGDLIKENLTERFNSFLDTLGYAAQGLKELFSGEFKAAYEQFKKAGKEAVDVYTGVNNSVDRAIQGAKDLYEAGKDYLSGVISQADAMVKAENAYAKLEIKTKKRILDLQIEAEELRRTRDNEQLAISERIVAGDLLTKNINAQVAATRTLGLAAIKLAKNNYEVNKSMANYLAIGEAELALTEAMKGAKDQYSEAQTSSNSLIKEANALNQLSIDGTSARAIVEKNFKQEQIKDTTDRLAAQRKDIEEELKTETDRLTKKRDAYKEGTIAYEEANQELLNKQQELGNQLITNERTTNETIIAEKNASYTRIAEDQMLSFDARLEAVRLQEELINQTVFESEEAKTAAIRANSDKRKSIEQGELSFKRQIQLQYLDAISDTATNLLAFNEKDKKMKRIAVLTESAASIGKQIINTMEANTAALALGPGAPAQIAANFTTMGVSIASTIAATAKALSAIGGSGGNSGGGAQAKPSAPSFNVVGTSSQNQLAESIAEQQNVPVMAQVVGSQVTSQQALDRNVLNNATFI